MAKQPRIYISYRHADSMDVTERIHDRLATAFGTANIVRDPFNPGDDIRGRIREEVAVCDVMLVIIGPDWLTMPDPNNPAQRKLDLPNDWVRFEIETGLHRDSVRLIPVLVKRSLMPTESDLPVSIRELAFKTAAIVRFDPDFSTDVNRLIESIGGQGERPTQELSPNLIARFLASPIWQGIGGLAAIAAIILTIVLAQNNANQPTPTSPPATQAAVVPSNTPLPPTTTDVPQTNTLQSTIYIPPPETEVRAANIDITVTEIMLQRTVDAKETAVAQLFAESTHIVETANVPLPNTPIPPTSTDVPPTNTLVPPTSTTAPTLTPVPPTATPTDVQRTQTPIPLLATIAPIAATLTTVEVSKCLGYIVSLSGATSFQLFSNPSINALQVPNKKLDVGKKVIIVDQYINPKNKIDIWYKVNTDDLSVSGWLEKGKVQPTTSPACLPYQ